MLSRKLASPSSGSLNEESSSSKTTQVSLLDRSFYNSIRLSSSNTFVASSLSISFIFNRHSLELAARFPIALYWLDSIDGRPIIATASTQ
jgi:hypothetical protein